MITRENRKDKAVDKNIFLKTQKSEGKREKMKWQGRGMSFFMLWQVQGVKADLYDREAVAWAEMFERCDEG